VDHSVGAVLAKLEVSARKQAVRHTRAWLGKPRESAATN
jgi:hypothetical protein